MATLFIESWCEERRWANENSWPLSIICDRLRMCTNLHGAELKQTARSLKKKQLLVLEDVSEKEASPLIHTLESLGAKVALK